MDNSEILMELADTGSIDELLQKHEFLTRDDVARALDHGASLIDADFKRAPITSLYRAYNGFMLGIFTASALLFDFKEEIEKRNLATARISEFLMEFLHEHGQAFDLPEGDNLEQVIEDQVRSLDEELADHYQLGLATWRWVVTGLPDDEEETSDKELAEALLQKLGHPPIVFDAINRALENKEDKTRGWNDMVTACLHLLREIVVGLQVEPKTCFVAIPFKAPYEERYLNFYREIAHRMKSVAIRAWGGVGHEEYQELLLALISKSGSLLADITETNTNVMLEIGFAMGQSKTILLVAEGKQWENAANIQMDWAYPYETEDDEWEFDQAERAGLYFTALNAGRGPGPIPKWSVKPVEVLQYLNEIMGELRESQ